MKKLLLIITIFVLFFSCETHDICGCVKETYRIDQGVTFNSSGLPILTATKVVLSIENISCNDEVTQQSNGDGTYFNIECN